MGKRCISTLPLLAFYLFWTCKAPGEVKDEGKVVAEMILNLVAEEPSVTVFCEFVLDPADEYQFGIPSLCS